MTAMFWAATATLLAYASVSLWLFHKSGQSLRHAENRYADLRALKDEQAEKDARFIADLLKEVEMGQVKAIRLQSELAKTKQRGEKAVVAAMEAAIHRQDEYEESLQAWQGIAAAALLMGAKAPKELPAAPAKPKPLPRGGFLVEGEPPVYLPEKEHAGFEYFAEAAR